MSNETEWVLVPREPTEAMQTAHRMYGDTSDWWSAVIAAATQPPAEAQAVALDYVPGKLDHTAPPRIWLQIDTSAYNSERWQPWGGAEGVSWYHESIGGLEIQYVRADIASPPSAPVGVEWLSELSDDELRIIFYADPRLVTRLKAALAQQPAAVDGADASPVPGLQDVRDAFSDIAALSQHLREGGPTPEDRHELSAALDLAVGIAIGMLGRLASEGEGPADG